ncbi:polyprotein [Phaiomys leucurus pegivirus]|nr:polyprotein [Phaiomys leucurus pegivirus]
MLGFLFLLVLGLSAGSSDTTSSTPETTTTLSVWGNFRQGWRVFGESFMPRIREGLRNAIEAHGPTVPARLDWGGSRFSAWGSGVAASFSGFGLQVKDFFSRNFTAEFRRAWRRGLVRSGTGLFAAAGLDVHALVAQAAGASMAQVAAPTEPGPRLDWRVSFAPFLLVFAFLCGCAGGMLGLPRCRHWCACLHLFSWPRRRQGVPTVDSGVSYRRAGALALGVLAAQVGECPVSAGSLSRLTAAPVAQRACWYANVSALTFSNCCNSSDILWCTPWLCWTLPGCAVCTRPVGCWTMLGGGVSVYPQARDVALRRSAMEAFGAVGWLGVAAEGFRLGEFYAAGLVAGIFLIGGPAPADLVCDVVCSQAGTTWWYQTAPTLSTILDFLRSVPAAAWALIESMPILFGGLLLFMLACGRWVQVVLLVLAVPGVLANSNLCDVYTDAEGIQHDGWPFRQCTGAAFASNGTECVCPFGVVIRHFDADKDPELMTNPVCPQTFVSTNYSWLCGWGSWWWLAHGVTRPYSHPYMPPAPFSAICYITTNRSELYLDILVHTFHGVGRYPNYTSGVLGAAPVSTCLLDRRPPQCGECFGGCFYEDGRHDRPFGVCGGGVRDGPWVFLPLATLMFPFLSSQRAWYVPSRAFAELAATKYGAGVGCGEVNGLINCWSCNLSWTLPWSPVLPAGTWFPLPGRPTDICVNPQFARARLPPPKNWLGSLQYVVDAVVGRTGCPRHPGWHPVCASSAFFPADGGLVVMAGDSQLADNSPAVLKHVLGLYVALVVFMANAGARVVPAAVVLAAFVVFSDGACYPRCSLCVCNFWLCYEQSCYQNVGSLCLPVGPRLLGCGRGHALPPTFGSVVLTASVGYAVGAVAGLPHGAWVYALSPLAERVPCNQAADFVCGPQGGAGVSGVDASWLSYLPLVALYLTPLSVLLCVCLLASVVTWRTSFPYRLFSVAIQLAGSSWREVCAVLAVAWLLGDQVWWGADAAVNQMVVAAPLAGWALRLPTWAEVVLGLLNLVLYCTAAGRPRLAALAAYKLSRGLGGVFLLGAMWLRGPGHGVLGYQLCLPEWDATLDFDTAWWYVAIVTSVLVVLCSLMTARGAVVKLRVYARWCRLYCWAIARMETSPLGTESRWRGHVGLVFLCAGVVWPAETAAVALSLVCLCACVDLLDVFIEYLLCASVNVNYLVCVANYFHSYLSDPELRAFLGRRWQRGELLYDHAGQVSLSLRERILALRGCLEPVALTPARLREVRDDTLTLTCGRWYGGDPVVARCGRSVLVGCASSVRDLPPGYTLTAPLLVLRQPRGFWETMRISLTGKGDVTGEGQVVLLGTAFSSAMGFGLGGVLYTTFHSSKGRSLATPHGARNAFWVSASDDVACYPLIPPISSLEPCSCSSASRWVLTRNGALVHGLNTDGMHVRLDCPTRLREVKGASGSPVLCDKGHAVGMMVGALCLDGYVQRVRYVKPWAAVPSAVSGAGAVEYPTVPATGFKEVPYFAPTGSGKSTKFPAKLAQEGHNVLVLNPSVVTTKAMGPYMKQLTGTSPSVFAGTGAGAVSVKTGSRLTYVTYGRFLVNPKGFMQGKSVVICDECHATDGTSVLAMGAARTLAEEAGVKLLVFATATPPGTQFSPHSNITEVELDGDGDIPFYGVTLNSERYRSGRHVIFCHSKAECGRVADELAARGVKAVTYWRGKSASVLTDAADLTVVATDAISTGYTGNFATSTDCCSVVEEDVDIDLNPTFSIILSTRAADAALRMQRRGRCGRGAPGTYYAVQKGAPPSGVCSTATAWAAAEAGYMWYGMPQGDLQRYLQAFQECPYTSRLPGSPGDAVRTLAVLLPMAHSPEVTQEALRETSWAMLVGIQKRVCAESDAGPPSDDIRWAGVNGTNATPLLYRIGTVTAPCTSHPLALKMAAVLGDTSYHDTSIGPVLLVGAAVAAACALVDATGSLVCLGLWTVSGGGYPVYPDATTVDMRGASQAESPEPKGAIPSAPQEPKEKPKPTEKVTPEKLEKLAKEADTIKEVATSLEYPFLATLASSCEQGATRLVTGAHAAYDAAAAWWNGAGALTVPSVVSGSRGAQVMCFLERHITPMLAGAAAVASAQSSPVFCTLASFVAGVGVVVPVRVAWSLTLAGACAVGYMGGPRVGLAAGAAFWAGSYFAGYSWVDCLLNLAAGYEACISTCALVLDLLEGRATWQNAVPCLTGVLAPGSAAAGVAIALVLKGAQAGDMTPWMNRLLSMLPRSQVLPDGFFAESVKVHLGDVVRRLSLVQMVRALCERSEEEQYTFTSSTWVGRLLEFCLAVVRWCTDSVRARLPSVLPAVPFYACQPGYSGAWHGAGTAVTTCSCGHQVSITAAPGENPVVNASLLCRAGWRGCSFPINTTTSFTGSLRPDLSQARDVSLMVGSGHVVRLKKRAEQWEIVSTTLHCLTRDLVLRAATRGPVESDGVLVSRFVGPLEAIRFTKGQTVQYDGILRKLPIRYGKLTYPNMPYAPAMMPENGSDVSEAVFGTCRIAVETALTAAEEATDVAEAVVTAARPLIGAAFEARRKAEYEAWLLRERELGRVQDVFDVVKQGEESSHEVGEGPSLEFKSTDECLKEESASSDPWLDRGATHLMMEEIDVGDPVPLTSEPLLKDCPMPDAPEGAAATVEVAAKAAQAVGVAAKTFADALKAGVAASTDLAGTAMQSLAHIPSRLKKKKKVKLREVQEEPINMTSITGVQHVHVNTNCGGERRSINLRVKQFTTMSLLECKCKLDGSHPHAWYMGRLALDSACTVGELGEPPVLSLEVHCVQDKELVTRKFVHRCCGEDRSCIRTLPGDMTVADAMSKWEAGVYVSENLMLQKDTILAKTGFCIEVYHEEPCGPSYIWSGRAIKVDEPKEAPVTRPLTAQLRARADRVYVTDPKNIGKRIAKVTIDQVEACVDGPFKDAYNLAKANAHKILSPGYTFDEAVARLRPKTARGHNSNLTAADLKAGRGRDVVEKVISDIQDGTIYSPFMLRPKSEVFPQTRETHKPPRLIVYPSIEFRVAEKMILGDPALVAKAVMGESYGFQYPPHRRAEVLVGMWRSKRNPVAYTVDGVCFDSTITPADITREGEIFAAASPEPALVRRLHEVYAGHPMVDPSGSVVGYRRCRASGTLTTSAGNSITCYLKVSAACRKAGLVNPSYLIHGDDVVIICERCEEDQSSQLGEALRSYGYECEPQRHADLTTAESCSSALDTVRTVRGTKHVLRCDMRRGLGRTVAEYGDPVGTAWGYALNYPTHPVSMYIILPMLLQTALNEGRGPDHRVTVDVRGNSLTLPLHAFGKAVRGLHGRDALAVTGHSATVLQETFDCLQFFGMRGLGHWRRYRRKVKIRLKRAGGFWASLARELLWDPGDAVPPDLSPSTLVLPPDLWEHSWEGLTLTAEAEAPAVPRWPFVAAALLLLLLL